MSEICPANGPPELAFLMNLLLVHGAGKHATCLISQSFLWILSSSRDFTVVGEDLAQHICVYFVLHKIV